MDGGGSEKIVLKLLNKVQNMINQALQTERVFSF